jgi:hypothetical protein
VAKLLERDAAQHAVGPKVPAKQVCSSLQEALRILGVKEVRPLPVFGSSSGEDKTDTDREDLQAGLGVTPNREDLHSSDAEAGQPDRKDQKQPCSFLLPLLSAWQTHDQGRIYLLHPWPFHSLQDLLHFSRESLSDDADIRLIIHQVSRSWEPW